jgi:Arc/MetJ family transcription regulator
VCFFKDLTIKLCAPILEIIAPICLNVYITLNLYTLVIAMRTNIVIDDELMDEALKLSETKTKREVVELGLKALIKLKKQENIKQFKGKLKWTGDLKGMRANR